MNTRVVHRLTGYDRRTELLASECDIPIEDIARVREIARVGPDDPDVIGSYLLDRQQAERIARLLGAEIDADRYDFFLEPFAA
jgi:hypothetical protein